MGRRLPCLYRRADRDEFVRTSPDEVRDLRARSGDRPWAIAVGGSGRGQDAEAEREHIRSVAEAGADWRVEWVPPASRDAMRTAVARGLLA
ncbi:MAG TPA: hypothetical protein VKB73_16925 [Gaiellaceae bacterium]|nr:hypothetical protein [Gaiellaceae bacterium]